MLRTSVGGGVLEVGGVARAGGARGFGRDGEPFEDFADGVGVRDAAENAEATSARRALEHVHFGTRA